MITLPDGSTSDEEIIARFLNSEAHWQIVTDGPDATCPTCGYPERHRVYGVDVETESLLADGCPSCETSRFQDRTICDHGAYYVNDAGARVCLVCGHTVRTNGSGHVRGCRAEDGFRCICPVRTIDTDEETPMNPTTTIVCICGSTRFRDEIANARAKLTLLGEIVVGPEVLVRSDPAYADLHDSAQKVLLDELHLRKIDLADYVYVVNPGGYIGDSTRREIEYTIRSGKPVQYLVAPNRTIRSPQ